MLLTSTICPCPVCSVASSQNEQQAAPPRSAWTMQEVPAPSRPSIGDLARETELFSLGHRTVAGVDEVGRGALAGPVCVGMVTVSSKTGLPPPGLRDSKQLTARARAALVRPILQWADAVGLGASTPREIDELGIVGALALATRRALACAPNLPDAVVLDGNVDFITAAADRPEVTLPQVASVKGIEVVCEVKADTHVATVAAASILAKQWRDAWMLRLAETHPEYGWSSNKGYGSRVHLDALTGRGPTEHHRVSWSLPSRGAHPN